MWPGAASSVSSSASPPPGTRVGQARLPRSSASVAPIGLAREEPAYFSAMFEAGLPLANHPELQETGDRAFGVLRGACEVVVAGLPADKRRPP